MVSGVWAMESGVWGTESGVGAMQSAGETCCETGSAPFPPGCCPGGQLQYVAVPKSPGELIFREHVA